MMNRGRKLSFGEFLSDVRLVVTAPARRFAVIHERGASWGSLILLIIPTYLAFQFVGGVYFDREPFPGYSAIPPLILAVAAVYLKLYLLHIAGRLFEGRRPAGAEPGKFFDLKVVFGYTNVPAIVALLLATASLLVFSESVGYVFHNFKAISISILVAIVIALFIWNLILIVLALRTVYAMRDIKIIAAFILGSVLMAVPALSMLFVIATPAVDFKYVQPILSDKLLSLFTTDPTSPISSNTQMTVHIDRLCYRLREPERFELVAFLLSPERKQENRQRGAIVIGTGPGLFWENGEYALGRIVGIPGDTVELANGVLHLNGKVWTEPYLAPDCRSDDSLPPTTLKPFEYLILPENRHLIRDLGAELVVDRKRIIGRELLTKWPLGWWTYRSTIFLQPYPAEPAKAQREHP